MVQPFTQLYFIFLQTLFNAQHIFFQFTTQNGPWTPQRSYVDIFRDIFLWDLTAKDFVLLYLFSSYVQCYMLNSTSYVHSTC